MPTVSARARQLNHRLKSRKNAIIARREAEATALEDNSASSSRPNNVRVADMGQSSIHPNGDQRASISPTSGFVAVNSRQSYANEGSVYDNSVYENPRTANVTIVNGTSLHGASAATRAELLSKFFTNSERAASIDQDPSGRASMNTSRPSLSKPKPKPTTESNDCASLINSTSPVPIPNTPSSLLPHVKPSPADRFDDSGPYKAEMVARMEQLLRGDRIMPPCDRCRRLHMDCLKNLTACMGCTKKHAKCSWKDVVDRELRDNPFVPRINTSRDEGVDTRSEGDDYQNLPTISTGKSSKDYAQDDRIQQGVRDEELLGEDSDDDDQRNDGASAYHNPRTEPINPMQASHTDLETNHRPIGAPSPPHESIGPSTQNASLDATTHPTPVPAEPPTHHPNSLPAQYSTHEPTQEIQIEPYSPGSPQLSVHAVGRSLGADPQPTENSAKDEQADQERERDNIQHVVEDMMGKVVNGVDEEEYKEGGRAYNDGEEGIKGS